MNVNITLVDAIISENRAGLDKAAYFKLVGELEKSEEMTAFINKAAAIALTSVTPLDVLAIVRTLVFTGYQIGYKVKAAEEEIPAFERWFNETANEISEELRIGGNAATKSETLQRVPPVGE